MSDPTEAAAIEAKKAAFFQAQPDPPQNTLVAIAEAHADDAEPETDPKAPDGKGTAKSADAPKGTPATATRPVSSDAPLADRIVAALKAGDLDLLADLTDQDPAAFDEKTTKWAARNRKEAKLKDEIARVKADAAAVVEHYEPLDAKVAEFHKTKNYALVKEIFEMVLGEDFDSAAMKTFRAVRGQDPRVPELTKTLQAREAELGELRTTKEQAADRALREALRDDLPADHKVRKVPDWEDRVAKVLRESVDEDTGEPELSFAQAAARVVRHVRDEYQKYAGVFGDEPRAAAAKRERGPERAGGGSDPSTKRKVTREEFFASMAAKPV